jgi:hypothetical protein
MQPNLLQTVASVLRRSSHTDGARFPGKEQEFLTYRPHQRSGGSHRREEHSLALPPEGPNSVRVTFSRRSPQCRPLDLRNQVQSREKRAWNSSRRSRTEWQTITLYRSHERSGSHRREEPGSSIPEGPNSFRVTFSRRSPKCRALDLRNQVQSREKRAWNSSRRSHVRSCNSFENTESSG